jgi:hypothetical protein
VAQARVCKTLDAGSIPAAASNHLMVTFTLKTDSTTSGRAGGRRFFRAHPGRVTLDSFATSRSHHVNKNFTQTIAVRCDDAAPIIELLEHWDLNQASTDIMGYMGTRLLADRESPGHFLIVADFGVVDPDVSAADEANRNNERPETEAWAARLLELIDDEPQYRHYDELYRTDF